ncbi:sugar-binding transcriptional regulator [Demetria terragena]|uniref:sugar-binding transcriptional regulator n=1 Tax=Demetria terragena TaxID=63959 RepID=UPI00038136C1|nr:sugar-binding domain-containing protein [Demetria terragena]
MPHSRSRHHAHLAVAVARRYHLAGESKSDIARSLQISRFKVARLLEDAHAMGLVTIEVRDPDGDDPLGVAVARKFGLDECVVVRGIGDRDAAALVGAAAARVVERTVTADDVLGLPWSRAVHAAIGALTHLPAIDIVQLCGSLVTPGQETAYDIVREAGRMTYGHTLWYHAPLIMPTAEGASSLKAHGDIARARAAVDQVTVALCSIGAWEPDGSTVHDAFSLDEARAARERGVVGESMGLLFDEHGQTTDSPLAQRIITLTPDQLCRIPTVIGMARGVNRAAATRAALRGRWIRRLVVDDALAEALLT